MILQLYQQIRQFINALLANALPPAACRFTPTCSVYCTNAVSKHGLIIGSLKCLWRILRCHPLSRGGYDPI